MLKTLDLWRVRIENWPWIGLLLSALFLAGMFSLSASSECACKGGSEAYRANQQIIRGGSIAAIREPSENLRTAPAPQYRNAYAEIEPGGVWGWLVRYHDEVIAVGTLLLGFFAFLQWRDSRKSGERQLRAYVTMEEGNVYDASKIGLNTIQPNTVVLPEWKNYAAADLKITNTGQTPAKRVRHWTMIAISDAVSEGSLRAPKDLPEEQASVIGVGGSSTKSTLLLPFPLTEPVASEIKFAIKGIYVYGAIVYEDVFGRERRTDYRVRYVGKWPPVPNGTLSFCLHGNTFD